MKQEFYLLMKKTVVEKLSFFIAGAILLLASCTSPEKLRKEMVYFNEGLDTAKLNQYMLVEPIIQKGDLLQITISSRSSSSNQLFSQNYSSGSLPSSGGGAPQSPVMSGHLVDIATGEIKLPLLGVIQADGMTKLQLEKEIIRRASDYLKEDPIVNIRYMNFSVTFLGAVQSPGRKTFESERINFLQALGEVGGIAQGGSLKNILLQREQNGKRIWQYIDLTKGDFLNSPNYYLRQNDVIYVSPTKRQLQSADQSFARTAQIFSLGLSIINLLVILITQL
ncbi:MAG: polysaccharide biosynthesis/export family protein [Chitinophagaceae bacterium]|nr:polysaccharide biosynthesis/export family protein [Chitinophagaceae bacterium]